MAKRPTNPSLRAFHRLGEMVLRSDLRSIRRTRKQRAWGSIANMHDKTGIGISELGDARRFAKIYSTAKKLDEICSLGQVRGQPLKESHVRLLIRLTDPRQRDRLAKRCARESWTVKRLTHEIRRIVPHRGYGGAHLSPPRSWADARREAESMAKRWIDWTTVLSVACGGGGKPGVLRGKQIDALKQTLETITPAIRRLHEQVRSGLDRQRAPRRKRPGR